MRNPSKNTIKRLKQDPQWQLFASIKGLRQLDIARAFIRAEHFEKHIQWE